MSREESEGRESARGDPGALAIALGSHDPAMAKVVRHYLVEQAKLSELQAEELKDEMHWRHWSLRVRHISDVMKLAFELSLALIFTAIVVAIGFTVWSATRAEGLVIEPFNVPGHMAEAGLTGPVIASKLLDRLTVMQNTTNSLRAASSFTNDWTNDIKVQIPETGVSLGQVVRTLHDWLGNEMHLSGEVTETGKGLAITVRLDNDPGQTFEGADLDKIVRQAAEAVFRRAQPYRFAVYLLQHSRLAESQAVLRDLARNGPPNERAWANLGLAIYAAATDRNQDAIAHTKLSQADNPDLPNAFGAVRWAAQNLGHDEEALAADRTILAKTAGPGAREWDQSQVATFKEYENALVAERLGDYGAAIAGWQASTTKGSNATGKYRTALDALGMHDLPRSRAFLASIAPDEIEPDTTDAADIACTRGQLAIALQDWRGAITDFETVDALVRAPNRQPNLYLSPAAYHRVLTGPWLAYAHEMLGERDKADAILKALPLDCYLCTRVRGKIDASRKNWSGAGYWFASAVKQAPSISFAETDWGAMLLRKGDFDSAIAKFATANAKGPHFADPLEMWGEALIAKNRSDLALAKFAEADKYAPHWGRLHLKWGEALFWLNRKDEAQKQFDTAARLDLSKAEKIELARRHHG